MVDYSTSFFSFMSVSAILLSLCAAQRSSAFSSLASDNTTRMDFGGKDYEEVLRTSGKRAQIAGFMFTISTSASLLGYILAISVPGFTAGQAQRTVIADWVGGIIVVFFSIGLGYLAGSLTVGHGFSSPIGISFQSPLKINTPKESSESGRPETVDDDQSSDQTDNETVPPDVEPMDPQNDRDDDSNHTDESRPDDLSESE